MQYHPESSSGMSNKGNQPISPQTNSNQLEVLPSIAFIINHINFSNHRENQNREGSRVDVKSLEEVLCELQIENEILQDPLKNDVEKLMNDIAERDFSGFAAILIFIMSHGSNNGIIFTNDPGASNYYFVHEDIRCPLLMNRSLRCKHKLIFVQACRGSFIPLFAESSRSRKEPTEPAEKFLVLSSSYEGSVSYLSEDDSLFIQAICRNFRRFGETKCISFIADSVIKDVKEILKFGQTPTVERNYTTLEDSFIIGEYAKHKGVDIRLELLFTTQLLQQRPVSTQMTTR